jgi:hypothetical protein
MKKPSRQTLFLTGSLAMSALVVGYLVLFRSTDGMAIGPWDHQSKLTLADIPFNGAQAYQYLERICALGPRVSGSAGMRTQQKMLADYFQKLGARVEFQAFRVRDPRDGSPVSMANLIVHWHPDRKERILLAAHYDTRPFPDRDRKNPQGTFLGANDGASGVAVLMEMGHKMPGLEGQLGVDFVLFDGEEYVFEDRDPYFLGSEYFAREYVANPPPYHYRWAVVLDMVGDADLQIYQERYSTSWRDTKPLVKSIWETAKRLGVKEFVAFKKYEIRDDHLALHDVAKIPTCDIIDFDFSAWHTTDDTPQRCSALSLAKVGWVMSQWLDTAVMGP